MFTKRKFLNLEPHMRHRKCAEILRSIYEERLKGKPLPLEQVKYYASLLDWLQLNPYEAFDLEPLADRYHWHLAAAGLRVKEHHILPHIRTGDRIVKLPFGPAAIYLDHVRSAYNVGSILRTCEALRIGNLYFSEKTPFIDDDKVKRTALGAAEIVPCFKGIELASLPRPIIVLDTSDEAIPVSQFIFPKIFTLILGNEEYGVSKESLAQADYVLEVSMFGAKNSLNVACAFAIAAAEIRRQL